MTEKEIVHFLENRLQELKKYKKQVDLILKKQLCRKEYATNLFRMLDKQIKAVESFLSTFLPESVSNAYKDLHPGKQLFVNPLELPAENFVDEWKKVTYSGKSFDENPSQFFTQKGERVRSKSEILIADSLVKNKVPYRYEYPINLNGRTIYPDFCCLNVETRKEILWEHFGMMDNPEYAEKAVAKLNSFQNAGYFPGRNLIITMETSTEPLNTKSLNQIIQTYLK